MDVFAKLLVDVHGIPAVSCQLSKQLFSAHMETGSRYLLPHAGDRHPSYPLHEA